MNSDSTEKCIGVFPTYIGFRGGNAHTGDRTEETFSSDNPEFLPFPGEVLCEGRIAQGDAGRMGCGSQIVATIPENTVFRTAYYGRLYGSPAAHYYRFNGKNVEAMTWGERVVSDIW